MTVPPVGAALAAAALRRRMASFVYEGVLLFGVVMAAGLVYSPLAQQRHAMVGKAGLQWVVFLVLAAYFVACWTRGGQTLAMKTWQIRLVAADGGGRVSVPRALCRYLLSWLWFVPALLVLYLSGVRGSVPTATVLAAGVLTYAALSRLHPDRQFLHDACCGTRLVAWRTPARQGAGR